MRLPNVVSIHFVTKTFYVNNTNSSFNSLVRLKLDSSTYLDKDYKLCKDDIFVLPNSIKVLILLIA